MSETYGIRFGGNITKISHVSLLTLREPVIAWTDDGQRVVIEAGTELVVEEPLKSREEEDQ